jgi:hypothetical protein
MGGHGLDQPGHKMRLYLKNNQSRKGWCMAQVIEHLPNKCKALCSNQNQQKKKSS